MDRVFRQALRGPVDCVFRPGNQWTSCPVIVVTSRPRVLYRGPVDCVSRRAPLGRAEGTRPRSAGATLMRCGRRAEDVRVQIWSAPDDAMGTDQMGEAVL